MMTKMAGLRLDAALLCLQEARAERDRLAEIADALRERLEREIVWNSRDGVTPYGILAMDGRTMLYHVNWSDDERRPDYRPPLGSRVFEDRPFQKSLELHRRRVMELWGKDFGHGCTLAQAHPGKSPDEVAQMFAEGDWYPGEPHLTSVTAEWLDQFEQARGIPDRERVQA